MREYEKSLILYILSASLNYLSIPHYYCSNQAIGWNIFMTYIYYVYKSLAMFTHIKVHSFTESSFCHLYSNAIRLQQQNYVQKT